MIDSEDLHVPLTKGPGGDVARKMIDFYLATNAPLVGMAGPNSLEAPDDIGNDGNPSVPISERSIQLKTKRYCAEKFIGKFVQTLTDLGADAHIVNHYLERIANHEDYPDHVVDAAIRFQDILAAETPDFEREQEKLIKQHFNLTTLEP